jgi:hypothetical protein
MKRGLSLSVPGGWKIIPALKMIEKNYQERTPTLE